MHAFVCTLCVRTAPCSNHVFQHMKCVTCWFRSYVMRFGLHTPHTPTTRPSRNPSLNEHLSTSSPNKTNASLTFPGGSSSSQQQHHHQQQRKPDANAEHLWKEACYASMRVQVGGGRSSATMRAVSVRCLPPCGSSSSSRAADDGTHINKCQYLCEDPAAAAAAVAGSAAAAAAAAAAEALGKQQQQQQQQQPANSFSTTPAPIPTTTTIVGRPSWLRSCSATLQPSIAEKCKDNSGHPENKRN